MSRTVFIEQDLTAYMGFGIRQQFLVSREQDQELFHSPVRICRRTGMEHPFQLGIVNLKEVADVPSVGFYCIHITVDGFLVNR